MTTEEVAQISQEFCKRCAPFREEQCGMCNIFLFNKVLHLIIDDGLSEQDAIVKVFEEKRDIISRANSIYDEKYNFEGVPV